jgi:hypothetical protein
MTKQSVASKCSISIHFDGEIAKNHSISMRTLGKSLHHLQSAIDRAHLDVKYGNVWKHARTSTIDRTDALFVTSVPQEGGFILDFVGDTPAGKFIVDRLVAALRPAIERAMEGGERQIVDFAEQIETRKRQVASSAVSLLTYQNIIDNPPEQISRRYGDRSIVKEFDQIASIVRSSTVSDDSAIELLMAGETTNEFIFNKPTSKRFHAVVAEKLIGEPVIYLATITSLDHKNMKGKVYNVVSKKEANIYFTKAEDFFKVKPHLGREIPVKMIACPLIEYGAFDPKAGDIYFVGLLSEDG